MGHTLCLTFGGLQALTSHMSRRKEECWGWILKRVSIVSCGYCLRGGYFEFPQAMGMEVERLVPLEIKTPLQLTKKSHKNLGTACLQRHQGLPIWHHPNLQHTIFSPNHYPHFKSKHPAKLRVEFAL